MDLSTGLLTEEPIRLAEGIGFSGTRTGRAGFAISKDGTLIYRASAGTGLRRFVWFDRGGKQLGTVGEISTSSLGTSFDLSPDGKQVAVSRSNGTNQDIWLMDLVRGGVMTRFTFDPAGETDVVWSPDGSQIAFSSRRKGNYDIFEKNASGIGEELSLIASPEPDMVEDWSKDGLFEFEGVSCFAAIR